MKNGILLMLVAAVAVPAALALPTITVNDGPGSPGGIFNVVTTGNGNFQTFCIEYNEYLNIGGNYKYEITTAARFNNQNVGFSDPISLATAWLYKNFKTASGTGITPYVNDAAHNNAIQNAIWFLENEGGADNAYVAAAKTGAGASWASDANGQYGVYVMNLYYNTMPENPTDAQKFDNRRQDLLVHVPDGGMTLAMLGMGLAGLGFFARRRD